MKSKLRSFFQNDKNELKSGTHIFQLIINKTKTIFVNKPRINFFPQYTLTNSNVEKKKNTNRICPNIQRRTSIFI